MSGNLIVPFKVIVLVDRRLEKVRTLFFSDDLTFELAGHIQILMFRRAL